MKKIFIFTALIAIAGCVSKNTKTEPQQAVGMPNPASVYCVQSSGKSETVDTPSGQVGYCILPSKERIEEWELYRKGHSN
ncbi:DUF333 domain-containing protein [Providencia sp. CRE-3FA-0001]|uniref:DUF333 domain-containing protein n=1 Tax=Providencia huashanensis TaxID=3037798 RepID=A0AA42FMF4_9GAMM|nr:MULTISPECIES: DUF333 domain-containing protein [unclassified Providencia]MDG4696715.1 DUF333 domain-containing protein [Providencia sp. CRE-3FA-0001]MDO7830205.1 DUF333 domain-containing protein [Providencia sp. CRE-138-0026]MDO7855174.1 DUF333 domain-containing protein [Providencia sp. CRE-138-0111]